MCKCTPSKRTPFCGKGDCVWPEQAEPVPGPDLEKIAREARWAYQDAQVASEKAFFEYKRLEEKLRMRAQEAEAAASHDKKGTA